MGSWKMNMLCRFCLEITLFLFCSRDEVESGYGTMHATGAGKIIVKSARRPAEDTVVIVDCTPFCKRLGLMWPEGQQLWFVKDICGVICAVFTWMLVGYAEFVVLFVMLIPGTSTVYATVHGVLFTFLSTMAVSSHVRTMLTDPVSSTPTSCSFIINGIIIVWHSPNRSHVAFVPGTLLVECCMVVI